MQAGRQSIDQGGESLPTTATLRFRHSHGSLGVSRHGRIRPGGLLAVEYDPARLTQGGNAPISSTDILCHVRFQPAGQTHSESVLEHTGPLVSASGPPRPALLEVAVPAGTTEVELWFERREPAGISAWDSRYGQNYTFDVSGEGLPIPKRSVAARPDTLIDLSKIRVVEDAATKEEAGRGMSVRTLLIVRALTGDPATAADTWADVHVFDAAGDLIHAGSVAFRPPERTADPALRVWEDEVYQGSGGGSGMGGCGPARTPTWSSTDCTARSAVTCSRTASCISSRCWPTRTCAAARAVRDSGRGPSLVCTAASGGACGGGSVTRLRHAWGSHLRDRPSRQPRCTVAYGICRPPIRHSTKNGDARGLPGAGSARGPCQAKRSPDARGAK
jgi:Family of unknown function (DUF6209)